MMFQDKTLLLFSGNANIVSYIHGRVKGEFKDYRHCAGASYIIDFVYAVNPDILVLEWDLIKNDSSRLLSQLRSDFRQFALILLIPYSRLSECIHLSEYAGVLFHDLEESSTDPLQKKLEKAAHIVEQKKKTQAQSLLLNQYKSAVDTASIVSKTDPEGNIIYVNEQFCQVSGYSKEELIGNSHNIIRHPDMAREVFVDLWSTILSKKVWQGVIKNRTKDGQFYIMDSTIIPLLSASGEIIEFISILHDVTETYRAKEKAEEQRKVIEQFFSNMSHEIRTPLSAMLGFITLLDEKIEGGDEKQYIQTIHSSGEVLLNVVNDILDFAKIEKGKLEIEQIPFFLEKELRHIHELFSASAREKGVRLELLWDREIPPAIKSDPFRIKQVISNLISNAIKFTPEGKRVSLITHFDKAEQMLEVSVKDEGIGIPPKHQKNIFDAFAQTDVSISRKFGGTGLGLSISASIIQMMDGNIFLESQEGKGSCFYFRIPVETCDSSEIKEEEIEQVDFSALDCTDRRIMVVEDNTANQLYMKIVLEKTAAKVDLASDAYKTLELYRVSHYDLILMDEKMPGMSGHEAVMQIRKMERDKNLKYTPIVAMTGLAIKETQAIMADSVDACLTKPLDSEKLLEVLIRFLGDQSREGLSMTEPRSIKAPQEESSGLVKLTFEEVQSVAGMDMEDVKELLELYKISTSETIGLMREGVQDGNFPEVARLSHKLIGSMGYMLGVQEVNTLARECEVLAKEQQKAALEEKIAEMHLHIKRLPDV